MAALTSAIAGGIGAATALAKTGMQAAGVGQSGPDGGQYQPDQQDQGGNPFGGQPQQQDPFGQQQFNMPMPGMGGIFGGGNGGGQGGF